MTWLAVRSYLKKSTSPAVITSPVIAVPIVPAFAEAESSLGSVSPAVAGLQTQDVQGGGGDGVDIPPRRLIGWQRVGVAHSRLPLGRGLWVAAAFGDDDADDVRVDDRDVENLPVRVRLRGDLALFGLRGRLNGGLRLVDGVGHGVLVILTMPPAATTRAEK